MNDRVRLTLDEIHEIATKGLRAKGYSERHARAIADTVTAAERDECPSHVHRALLVGDQQSVSGCVHSPHHHPPLRRAAPARPATHRGLHRLIGAVHRPTLRRIKHPDRKFLRALRRFALYHRAAGDCSRWVPSDPMDSDRLPGPRVPCVEHLPVVRNPGTVPGTAKLSADRSSCRAGTNGPHASPTREATRFRSFGTR